LHIIQKKYIKTDLLSKHHVINFRNTFALYWSKSLTLPLSKLCCTVYYQVYFHCQGITLEFTWRMWGKLQTFVL